MLFVSLFGSISSEANKNIIKMAEAIVSKRRGNKKIDLYFYNAESAHIWR